MAKKRVNIIIDSMLVEQERIRPLTMDYQVIEDKLFESLGLTAPYPYAAFFTLNTKTRDCLIATPIHLIAGHDNAHIIASGSQLNLKNDEYHAITESLNNYLKHYDLELLVSDSHQWILAGREISVDTVPIFKTPGRSLMSLLPKGKDQSFFHQLFTEIQMLLKEHPVNQRRRHLGQYDMNGLWLWGEGVLPLLNSARVVMTDSSSLTKWANKSDVSILPLALANEFIATFKKNNAEGVIFIRQFNDKVFELCKRLTKKIDTHWYFRNGAYVIKRKSSWWF